MELIKISHLFHYFNRIGEDGSVVGKTESLKDVSISVNQGEFLAVLGHNGSGKSTLAKHINALLLPSKGEVLVDGKNTEDDSVILLIRQEAGMVFQNPDNQMIANVVEEEVAFGPENIGIDTDTMHKRVEECLARVGMSAYRLHSPNRLSGGQKQRVAIASVLAMRPKCIILDEPTAMLDPNGRKEVIETLHELRAAEGITIILITHYMEETVDADRVIVMDDGEIALEGTPREVFSQVETLKNMKLDVPVATMLAWELKKEGFPIDDGILTKEELVTKICKVIG